MWLGWSIGFSVLSTVNLVVFLAILLHKKTRRNAFNQYLMALMIPDIIMTNFCAWQCTALSHYQGYRYTSMCLFQSFYIIWSVGANLWVNAVIALEVHNLLVASQRRQRYYPPARKRIVWLSLACYIWAAFLASWALYGIEWFPTDSLRGLVCLPLEANITSTIVWWTIFFIPIGVIPLTYVSYVAFCVFRRNLLPPRGKKREIAVFFFRIYISFCLLWFPAVFGLFAAGSESLWGVYFFGSLSHASGFVSAMVSLLKRDIWIATCDLVKCRICQANREFDFEQNRSSNNQRPPSSSRASTNSFNNTLKRTPSFWGRSWFAHGNEQLSQRVSTTGEDVQPFRASTPEAQVLATPTNPETVLGNQNVEAPSSDNGDNDTEHNNDVETENDCRLSPGISRMDQTEQHRPMAALNLVSSVALQEDEVDSDDDEEFANNR
ncbi:expressed unknown protein [Seminavis robusta]|uniref:G-protein coupled receptors family 1 profile domain-containing protein n=1 Tax=Seminavis robusta TaxID=568900 RepID=A0A9N8DVV1_9STRA|nr:expressed unknown protein [Seminavis robusta]|eukprot:Sro320_g116500.1 n/a (436) ;mRNA; f:32409-33801